MTRLANVIVAGTDAARRGALAAMLGAEGCAVHEAAAPTEVTEQARQGHPDVVAVDLDSPGLDAVALAAALAADADGTGTPVVFTTAEGTPQAFQRARDAGVDDVFVDPFDRHILASRLQPLLRLSTMRSELGRRRVLARRFGLAVDGAVDQAADGGPYAVPLLGGDGDLRRVETALPGRCHVVPCADPHAVEGVLQERPFDAALLGAGAADDETLFDLCDRVRHNPRLFNLPVVLLDGGAPRGDAAEPYRRGVTRVVAASASATELGFVVATLAERQRVRWTIRRAMAATRGPATCDAATGIYTFDFLRAHLSALIDAARIWRKHLTLVFFLVPDLRRVQLRFGVEAAEDLTRQLAAWIGGLVRVEDVTARHGEHDFCVALPDTPLAVARGVMERIAGILSYTDFAVQDVYQPVPVSVEVAMADLAPDDTAETLIARAHRALD